MIGGVRVEIVPDDDAQADPLIPRDILAALGPNDILMAKTGHMMYVRASRWAQIEHAFPPALKETTLWGRS